MNNTNQCPGCHHHCDSSNLQCSKGQTIFSASNENHLQPDNHHHPHSEHSHHHPRMRKHHKHPKFPDDSLADLLAKCTHHLFHHGEDHVFSALSSEEQTTLKNLLRKATSS